MFVREVAAHMAASAGDFPSLCRAITRRPSSHIATD